MKLNFPAKKNHAMMKNYDVHRHNGKIIGMVAGSYYKTFMKQMLEQSWSKTKTGSQIALFSI